MRISARLLRKRSARFGCFSLLGALRAKCGSHSVSPETLLSVRPFPGKSDIAPPPMSAVRRRPTAAECTRPRFGPVPPPAPIRGFRSLRRHAKTRPVQGDFPLGTLRIPFGTALGRTANATCFRRERNRYMSDDDIFPFSPLRSFRTVQPAAVRGSVSSRLRSRRRFPPPLCSPSLFPAAGESVKNPRCRRPDAVAVDDTELLCCGGPDIRARHGDTCPQRNPANGRPSRTAACFRLGGGDGKDE